MTLRPLRFLAVGATFALAACGGNAAPAASPSTAAPASAAPASAAAKPSTAAPASSAAKPAASSAAKPAASGAAGASAGTSAAAKPAGGAATGGAAAKPALPSSCPAASPAAAAKPAAGAAGGSAAAKPAAAPSFTPQTDVTGEAAPGPYKVEGTATAASGAPVNVIIPGLSFAPNTITVKPGDKVTLNMTNCTTFQHNFYSPGLNVEDKVNIPAAADNVAISFTAPDKPGKYMFWCTVKPANGESHAARGMTGEVIVQ